jgi:AraC-like DNA-binding protein
VPLGRLFAFWGGYPHRLVVVEGQVELAGATVPLAPLNERSELQPVVHALLSGATLAGTEEESQHDAFLLARWMDDLSSAHGERVSVCWLEIQSRLARLGIHHAATQQRRPSGSAAAEKLLAVAAKRYTSDVTVEAIAREAGVHSTYAAKTFTETFGFSLWQYVSKLRIAHAQRLLGTTDWTIVRVAYESGYRTTSAFYRAFAATVGTSPATYRRRATHGLDSHFSAPPDVTTAAIA